MNTVDAASVEPYSPEQLASQIIAESKTVSRVGFIGLGAMGFGMAMHLVKSNFCVIGYDVSTYFYILLLFTLDKSNLHLQQVWLDNDFFLPILRLKFGIDTLRCSTS